MSAFSDAVLARRIWLLALIDQKSHYEVGICWAHFVDMQRLTGLPMTYFEEFLEKFDPDEWALVKRVPVVKV